MPSARADHHPTKAGRTPRAAGLSSFLTRVGSAAIGLGLVASLSGCSADSTPTVAAPTAVDAADIAKDLGAALAAADSGRASALAASEAPAVAERLAAMAANVGRLHLRGITVVPAQPPGPDGTVMFTVRWRLPGVDPDPIPSLLTLRLVRGSDGPRILTVGSRGQTPLWLLEPVDVHRSRAVVVIVGGSAVPGVERAPAVAAVRTVRTVLPRWSGRLAVEVPADAESFDAVLGVPRGERAADAAVTTTLGDPATSRSSRVVLNPDVFSTLTPLGRRVVLAHEATHVAVDAAASSAPLWLVEGFADYVALRDVNVPIRSSAADLVGLAERRGPLDRLPGERAFASSGGRLASAYQASWLACLALAERDGERSLVRFYRSVDRGGDVTTVLSRDFGLGQRRLAELVGRRVSAWAR